MKIEELMAGDPTLRQIVLQNTNKNKDKVLDVVVTDLFTGYQEPCLLPAVPVDPGRQGVPSDHSRVEVKIRTNLSTSSARPKKETFVVQRMPDSLVAGFGQVLVDENWNCLEDGMSVEEMVAAFEVTATRLVDQHFPKKRVSVVQGDLPYFTEELRQLRRQRDHIYQRNGKSQHYFTIQSKFQLKLKAEALKYKNRIIQEVQEGKRGSGYSAIRKLGEGPAGSDKKRQFLIPAFVEEGLSPQQSANRLADYFSAISQTVEPLDVNKFHPALQLAIQRGREDTNKPIFTQHEVYRTLLKIKKPNSRVEGDVPKKLISEFSYLWAGPASIIFNKVIKSSEWPPQWKIENAVVLHKTENVSMVKTEDDVRTISQTSFLSKLLENMLFSWLLPIVDPYLDPGQCGGLSKTSTSHYLIKLLDFIHVTLDKRTPHAAVLAALDMSKAYNRGDSMVIEDLHAMHTPGWLLAVLCSYLSSRSMVLSYQAASSSPRPLPGGYGAGTLMGGFLFIIKFNGICLRPSIPRPNGNKAIQLKFVDDATKAASINMKKSLIQDPKTRPFPPLQYNERTQMVLNPCENILQQELDRFQQETEQCNFVTNKKKTVVMLFNASRKYSFPPEFSLGQESLAVKSVHKILRLFVQNDLR